MKNKIFTIAFTIMCIGGFIKSVNAITLSSVGSSWSDPVGGSSIHYINDVSVTYGNNLENQIRWGNPHTGDGQSGLGFTGIAPPSLSVNVNETFEIGQIRHFNHTISSGSGIDSVALNIFPTFSNIDDFENNLIFNLTVDETPNDPPPGDDFIYFPLSYPTATFTIDSPTYTLKLLGFGETADTLVSHLRSPENGITSAKLWGTITRRSELQRPDFEIPSHIDGTGRNAVVITHGWNSDIEAWAIDDENKTGVADKICKKLNSSVFEYSSYEDDIFLRCSTPEWDVFVLDWSSKSGNAATWLENAYAEAYDIGELLGVSLVNVNYQHIHLIAHSAGSNLIDTAKYELLRQIPKPTIHMTFFDAYDPFPQDRCNGQLSSYGKWADWVDNYVDTRTLSLAVIGKGGDKTKLFMPNAYNVDVTAWDPEFTAFTVKKHSWPYRFYIDYTFQNMEYPLGFQLSLENNNYPPANRDIGKACILPEQESSTTLVCQSIKQVCTIGPDREEVHTLGDSNIAVTGTTHAFTGSYKLINNSSTGTVEHLVMNTGSPTWFKMNIETQQPVESVEFDYSFLSAPGAEGYLTVMFDNVVVRHIDERFKKSGVYSTGKLYIGEVTPGKHEIAFRLDPYNDTQSSIKISNVKFAKMQSISSFPWGMFRPAMSGGKTPVLPATCDAHHLNFCTTAGTCTVAEGYWYNTICNNTPETATCNANHLNFCSTSGTCTASGGHWYNNTCNSIPEPATCDVNHLNLCTTSGTCTAAGGFWYNHTCNSIPEPATCDVNHLNLCTTSGTCTAVGGFWYNYTCNSIPEPVKEIWQTAKKPDLCGHRNMIHFSLDGFGYIIPTYWGTDCNDQWGLWRFDPSGNSWQKMAAVPLPHAYYPYSFSTFTIGSNAYLLFGVQLWTYNASANHWQQKAVFPGNNPEGQEFAFGINGKGYVGGDASEGNDLWEYDAMNDRWTQKNDHPNFFDWIEATGDITFTINDKGYVIVKGLYLWKYTPTDDSWKELPSMNIQYNASFSGAFSMKGKGYVFNSVGQMFEFNPIVEQWKNDSSFPGEALCFPVAFSINEKGYVGLGTTQASTCNDFSNEFWLFNPVDQ